MHILNKLFDGKFVPFNLVKMIARVQVVLFHLGHHFHTLDTHFLFVLRGWLFMGFDFMLFLEWLELGVNF